MTQTAETIERAFAVRRLSNEAAYEIELLLYDYIGVDPWTGEGISAKAVAEELKQHRNAEKIFVRINSFGGYTDEGHAIYNQLRRHKARVVVTVDGVAMSAASVVAMAGDEIEMAANSLMMIHRAWGIVVGNAEDLAQSAEVFGKVDGTIAGVYAARAGGEAEAWLKAMSDETYYTAEEAVEAGLADRVGERQALRTAARFDAERYHNMPEWARKRIEELTQTQPAGAAGKQATHGSGAQEQENEMSGENRTEAAALEAAKSEGAKAERQRIAAIDAALPGEAYAAARRKAVDEGLGVEAAKALAFDAAHKAAGETARQLAEANERLAAAAAGGLTPVPQGRHDEQGKAEEDEKKAAAAKNPDPVAVFEALVREKIEASGGKLSRGRAMSHLAEEKPAEHAAWLAARQPK